MYDLTIITQNGGAYIDSREVAEIIGKQHGHLMRDIRGYVKTMEKITQSNFGVSDFFLESSYFDSTGRTLPCYLLTKMGCELVANKLTGEKGVLFTTAYVYKFNAMETAELEMLATGYKELREKYALLSDALHTPPVQPPRLGEFNACARIIIRSLRDMGATSEQIFRFLKGAYEPLGIAVAEENDFDNAPQMYTAKQIAKKLGIYSINGNPHYQAVSCILNENIFIGDNHRHVTTHNYGEHIGICVLYDGYALQSVKDWLVEHGLPKEVYGFERTYQVLYRG